MHGDAPHDEREACQDRDPDQIDRLEPEGGAANELHELVERVELGRDLKALKQPFEGRRLQRSCEA